VWQWRQSSSFSSTKKPKMPARIAWRAGFYVSHAVKRRFYGIQIAAAMAALAAVAAVRKETLALV